MTDYSSFDVEGFGYKIFKLFLLSYSLKTLLSLFILNANPNFNSLDYLNPVNIFYFLITIIELLIDKIFYNKNYILLNKLLMM